MVALDVTEVMKKEVWIMLPLLVLNKKTSIHIPLRMENANTMLQQLFSETRVINWFHQRIMINLLWLLFNNQSQSLLMLTLKPSKITLLESSMILHAHILKMIWITLFLLLALTQLITKIIGLLRILGEPAGDNQVSFGCKELVEQAQDNAV